MYLKRKLDAFLQEWKKDADRKPLIVKGALYENIVAEILSKQEYELFYYKKENSTLEQDFLYVRKSHLCQWRSRRKPGLRNHCQLWSRVTPTRV